jgi:hypothetical protein
MQTSNTKSSYSRKLRECPDCGHAPVASIFYGMPDISDELFEKNNVVRLSLGGCVIELDQSTWQCSKCEVDFYRRCRQYFRTDPVMKRVDGDQI